MLTYIAIIIALITAYTELNVFLIKRRSRKPGKIMDGAEPWYWKSGKRGVLMIHGFSTSPYEFKELGKFLLKKGCTVYCPLLPGHGISPERLSIVHWYDYIETLSVALKTLERDCNEIHIIGNSFGGNLACLIANKSEKVKSLVLLGSPFVIKHYRIKRVLLSIFHRLKVIQKKKYKKEVQQLPYFKEAPIYNAIPLRSLFEVKKILGLSRKELKNVEKPILIMQAVDDSYVSQKSPEFILKNIQSVVKEVVWVENSYHLLVVDRQKKKVFKRIEEFVR